MSALVSIPAVCEHGNQLVALSGSEVPAGSTIYDPGCMLPCGLPMAHVINAAEDEQ